MLQKILQTVFAESRYLVEQVLFRSEGINWFWFLVILSLVVALGEKLFPWRKEQPLIRKQFWLDTFYMFFNFFIFKIIFFGWFSFFTEQGLLTVMKQPLSNFAIIDLSQFPKPLAFILFFIAYDFVQWLVHIMLHRIGFLWEFHQVHHSVEEMSFPAHLRYHWMENVIYTPVKYLTVAILFGVAPETAVWAYLLSTAIGHLNHSNMEISYGVFKYIFNNPVMHIWHHSKKLPKTKRYGVNFGISLSIWDYLFGTNWIPEDGRDIQLGFPGVEQFPTNFIDQNLYPIKRHKIELVNKG